MRVQICKSPLLRLVLTNCHATPMSLSLICALCTACLLKVRSQDSRHDCHGRSARYLRQFRSRTGVLPMRCAYCIRTCHVTCAVDTIQWHMLEIIVGMRAMRLQCTRLRCFSVEQAPLRLPRMLVCLLKTRVDKCRQNPCMTRV